MKFDQDLCLNLQYDFGKMNSTLGSVVPLAMSTLFYIARCQALLTSSRLHWRESVTTLNDNFARQISCIAAFCRRKRRTIAKNTRKLFRAANRGNNGCSRLVLEGEEARALLTSYCSASKNLQEKENPAMREASASNHPACGTTQNFHISEPRH